MRVLFEAVELEFVEFEVPVGRAMVVVKFDVLVTAMIDLSGPKVRIVVTDWETMTVCEAVCEAVAFAEVGV